MLRLTIVCNASTISAPTTNGSMPRCGCAAWVPCPVMRMSQRSEAASNGPALAAICPTGMPGLLCSAKTASQGNLSNRPSSTMTRPPPPPSSAGWKIRCTVPSKLRVAARYLAAPSSIVVCPSWPQACILPSLAERCGELVHLLHRQASMSARRPIAAGELPRRIVPTTPVSASPRCTSQPNSASFSATRSAVRCSAKRELGMGVDVAADRGQFVLIAAHLGNNRHRSLPDLRTPLHFIIAEDVEGNH